MTRRDDDKYNKAIVIRKRIEPAGPSKAFRVVNKKTAAFWKSLLTKLRGRSIDDIERVQKAGVGIVEAEAAIKFMQAQKLDAQAMLIYAQAEQIRQETAARRLKEGREPTTREMADAEAELLDAVRELVGKGGALYVDSEHANGLLLGAHHESGELFHVWNMPLDETGLSTRAMKPLKAANIVTLGALAQKKSEDVRKLRTVGTKTMQEYKEVLEKYGLCFGMSELLYHDTG